MSYTFVQSDHSTALGFTRGQYQIRLNDKHIGDILMEFSNGTAIIHYFGLEEEFQGKGHGREAWSALEQVLIKRGIRRVFIYDYESARGFWKRMGFKGDDKILRGDR